MRDISTVSKGNMNLHSVPLGSNLLYVSWLSEPPDIQILPSASILVEQSGHLPIGSFTSFSQALTEHGFVLGSENWARSSSTLGSSPSRKGDQQ